MAVWNTGFEALPDHTQSAGSGGSAAAATIINFKQATRLRIQTEMNFGDSSVSSGSSTDTGRNRPGSAVIFYQNTAPATLSGGTTDANGSSALSVGASSGARGWGDSGNRARLWAFDPNNPTVYAGVGPAWVEASANCGLIPVASTFTGHTATFFTVNTWVRAVPDLAVIVPTTPNNAQYTLVVFGKVVVSNGSAGVVGFSAALSTTGLGATVVDDSDVALGATGLAGSIATIPLCYQIPAVAGTTYTMTLEGFTNAGAGQAMDRGINSRSTCSLYVWLLNAGAT